MAELGAAELSQMTRGFSDSQKLIFQSQYGSERKDRGTALILAVLGWDRFWLGDIGVGVLKYITAGGCLIWWLVDIFTAGSRCDDYNRRKAQDIVAALRVNDDQPAVSTVARATAARRCANCGAPQSGNQVFCSDCGTKFP